MYIILVGERLPREPLHDNKLKLVNLFSDFITRALAFVVLACLFSLVSTLLLNIVTSVLTSGLLLLVCKVN
jgi:hypothetical protein